MLSTTLRSDANSCAVAPGWEQFYLFVTAKAEALGLVPSDGLYGQCGDAAARHWRDSPFLIGDLETGLESAPEEAR